MAEIQYTKFDRNIRYLKKKSRTVIHGLRPTSIVGRLHGPRVLINSLPKAGTHLLEGFLEEMPYLRNAGWRTLVHRNENRQFISNSISKIGNGMFANAHLGCHSWLLQELEAKNIKVVFLIRDPKDIIISRFRYALEIDLLHPAHDTLANLSSDDERIQAAILGIEGKMPSILQTLEEFSGWLNYENAMVLRFEDLIGKKGGGDDDLRWKKFFDLHDFLGIDVDSEKLNTLIAQIEGKTSSTHRKGKIGASANELSQKNLDLFNKSVGKTINLYGY